MKTKWELWKKISTKKYIKPKGNYQALKQLKKIYKSSYL